MRITLISLIILFLSSCSLTYLNQDVETLSYEDYKKTLSLKTFDKFKLNGKLSLFIDDKGYAGKIIWGYKNNKDTIYILNPFNTQIAEIILIAQENKVFLRFTKNNSKDSKELISRILGDKENLFLMKKFILNPPYQITNGKKVIINFKNWKIIYQGNKLLKNQLLPDTIEFKKNNINLKLFVSDWVS